MSLFAELKRRNVLRVAAAYIVTAWLIVQVVETLFPIYGLSDAAARTVVNILAIGLIPVLVVAWVFELTPEGLKKDAEVDRDRAFVADSAKRLDRIILVVLALALAYFAFDKFVLDPARDVQIAESARREGRTEALVESYGDRSIAVLAFRDMSPDKDQAYLSEGIAEEILNLLAKIPEMRVISRSSAFSYKDKDLPIPLIAEQLNVEHVLEGSVRKAGDRIRITAQLIEGRSDTHVWSQTYDRTLDDVFAIQDELAAAMVEQLQITLLGAVPAAQRVDPEAYMLYLQGHHFADYVDTQKAVEFLEQAVAIEPDYVDALLDLSVVYFRISETSTTPEEVPKDQAWLRSNAAWQRARELDPDHPTVLAFAAWETWEAGNLPGAAEQFERAVELHPRHTEVLRAVTIFTRQLGLNHLAVRLSRRMVDLDPLCFACNYHYARALAEAGHFEKAIEVMERFQALVPGSGGQITTGLARLELGDVEGAVRDFESRRDQTDGWYGPLMVRAYQGEDVAAELAEVAGQFPEHWHLYFSLAELYAVSGDVENAFRWLDKGEQITLAMYRPLTSRYFENLHDDPRWMGYLERAGIAPQQLAEIDFDPQVPGL
jgi:TolB-like protein/Tfp pilus assembly protein PilF